MKTTFHVYYQADLYEVDLDNKLIYAIRKYIDKGTIYRNVSFPNLPKNVQQQILNKIRSLP